MYRSRIERCVDVGEIARFLTPHRFPKAKNATGVMVNTFVMDESVGDSIAVLMSFLVCSLDGLGEAGVRNLEVRNISLRASASPHGWTLDRRPMRSVPVRQQLQPKHSQPGHPAMRWSAGHPDRPADALVRQSVPAGTASVLVAREACAQAESRPSSSRPFCRRPGME